MSWGVSAAGSKEDVAKKIKEEHDRLAALHAEGTPGRAVIEAFGVAAQKAVEAAYDDPNTIVVVESSGHIEGYGGEGSIKVRRHQAAISVVAKAPSA